MAWCAISLRSPAWLIQAATPSPSSPPCQSHARQETYKPSLPPRPTDTYTVRLFDSSTRPNLLHRMRQTVVESGGTIVLDTVEGRGFIFSMPNGTPNPLTGYQNGGLMEEGRIQVTKTSLDKEERSGRCGSLGSSDEEEVDENEEHPNLRMQWTWSDGKR